MVYAKNENAAAHCTYLAASTNGSLEGTTEFRGEKRQCVWLCTSLISCLHVATRGCIALPYPVGDFI
jgi:hypothetical protein